MKKLISTTMLCVAILASPALAAERTAETAFEELKLLVGEWKGEGGDGDESRAIYSLTANGTALVEEYSRVGRDDYDMLTVYHLDGQRLLLTHYCVAGNQPRMVAELGGDDDALVFSFESGTNMESEDGHMHRAVFHLIDEDAMTQEWTFRRGGEDAFTEPERFSRVKSSASRGESPTR